MLTDTGADPDPDDAQSLVRLLPYANFIDVRAQVATTSLHPRAACSTRRARTSWSRRATRANLR